MPQAIRQLYCCSGVLTCYAMYRQSFAAAVAVFAVPHRVQARSLRSKIRWALAHTANLMMVAATCGGVAATEHCVNLPTASGAQSLAPDTLTVDCPVKHLSTTPAATCCTAADMACEDRKESDPGATKTVGRRCPFKVCSLSLCCSFTFITAVCSSSSDKNASPG